MAMGRADANRQAHVLLVEDNEDHAELTRAALEASPSDIHLEVVSDGLAAMAFLRGEGPYARRPRPDMMLLDWNLPLMNGCDVLKTVKRYPAFAAIPVVVLTTSANEDDMRTAYRWQANGFITKPIDFLEFKEIINGAVAFWLQQATLERRGNAV